MNNFLKNKFFNLSGYTVFVTGAAGHLGKYISRSIADSGAKVIINGRNLNKLKILHKEICKKNQKCEIACFDINKELEVKRFFQKHNIDILINNAALSIPSKKNKIVKKDFEKIYNTNLISVANLTETCCEYMIKKKNKRSKSIINVGSIYGLFSPDFKVYQNNQPNSSFAYGASKAALNQLTKNMAIKYAKNKIRINMLTPGIFPNPKYQKKFPIFLKNIKSKIPLNRVGNPEEIITSILFLSSPYSSYVTGTNLVVDGGYAIL